jgi:type IX secretion system PorP/SprF family membrane protein
MFFMKNFIYFSRQIKREMSTFVLDVTPYKELSMKRKLLVLAAFMLVLTANVHAQENRAMTHSMYDKLTINPGSTGIENGICGTLLYRNQWDKVNGAPNSVVFNAEANLDRWIKSGLGISFYHDAIGFNRKNNVLLNYSFHLEAGDAGVLGLGLGLGIVNFGMSPVWITPDNPVDNYLPSSFSATNFDMNFGLYWKGTQNYYVGLSSTHLTQSILSDGAGLGLANFSTRRHYYLMGGWRWKEAFGSNREFDLDFNALMRTEFVKASVDFSARLFWKDLLYGGIGYRTSDAVLIMLGANINNFMVGYSYDISVNKFSNISWGTHEIMLRYCYIIPPPPITKSRNVRWL